jgi:hypothetical protein
MGWKDLFKSKTPKATPDPRIRWFGKLPTYADYYQSATDEAWVVEFNEWVLKGFELFYSRRSEPATQAGGQGSAHDRRLPAASVILRLPKSDMTVLGAVQDYGGDMRGRPFPLCFYVGLPTALWAGPTADRVVPALRLLRELHQLGDQVVRFVNSPSRFEQVFGGREANLAGLDDAHDDAGWLNAARAMPMADWFRQAATCLLSQPSVAGMGLAEWVAAARAWGGNIAKLESDDFEPTLRFPLVTDSGWSRALSAGAGPVEMQIAGWLRWLGRRMDLTQRFLSLLVSADPARPMGRLAVIARAPVVDDFLLLTCQAGSLAYVDDLCALKRAAARDAAALPANGGSVVAVAVRAPESWADFVDAPVTT